MDHVVIDVRPWTAAVRIHIVGPGGEADVVIPHGVHTLSLAEWTDRFLRPALTRMDRAALQPPPEAP